MGDPTPTTLGPTTYAVTREALVAYAYASGDPNPIHQDAEVARSVGLPDVIAHGMFTLALAARYVDEQLGEPGRIVELGAKFTKPVVVPEGGTEVEISGTWRDESTIALRVTCAGESVLGNPVAVVRA
jgi:acyl dehydratase